MADPKIKAAIVDNSGGCRCRILRWPRLAGFCRLSPFWTMLHHLLEAGTARRLIGCAIQSLFSGYFSLLWLLALSAQSWHEIGAQVPWSASYWAFVLARSAT